MWHGMGFGPVVRLARRHGFVLVGCDSSGTNAFLVCRGDAAAFQAGGAWRHFVPPTGGLPFGHPWRTHHDPLRSESDGDVALEPSRTRLVLRPGSKRLVRVRLANRGRVALAGLGPSRPVHIAAAFDGDPPVRVPQTWHAAPGRTVALRVPVRAPAASGDYLLGLYVVQEGVRWFGGWPPRPLATVAVTVEP